MVSAFFCTFARVFRVKTLNISLTTFIPKVKMQLIFIIFLAACILQILLHLTLWQRLWHRIRSQKKEQSVAEATAIFSDQESLPGISVLVYAHNQGELLLRNLPALLEQDYANFEVTVMDDASLDDTADILSMMTSRYEHLNFSRITEQVRGMSHRKLAVLLGAKGSHNEIIVMTQAQCLPASKHWLHQMARHFANPATEIVIGPVAYERRSSFLSRFCQFDLFQRLISLFSISLAIQPYAGWGQNLAFRKSTFYANRSQGFQRHLHIQPGEDDLFVADVARGKNVVMECQPDALITDQSSPLFANWSHDRLNRAFTSRLYSPVPAIVKTVDVISRYLTVLPGLALLAYTLYIIIVLGTATSQLWTVFGVTLAMLLIRAGLIIFTYAGTASSLHLRPFIIWPLFFDLYMPWVDVWFRCKALLRKKNFGVGYIGLK